MIALLISSTARFRFARLDYALTFFSNGNGQVAGPSRFADLADVLAEIILVQSIDDQVRPENLAAFPAKESKRFGERQKKKQCKRAKRTVLRAREQQ